MDNYISVKILQLASRRDFDFGADTTSFSRASFQGASTAAAGDLATVSITAAPGYQAAQACVQECLYFNDVAGLQAVLGLPLLLGCYTTVYNGCYCTSAVAKQASSIISSYIPQLCTGTSQISDAISVYDAYCTSAGYPSNANAQTTATTTTANVPQVTVVTSNIVYTLTVGSSTILVTEPSAIQTITSAPLSTTSSSSSSSNPNSPTVATTEKAKVNVGGIVEGIVGALVLIAILLAIFFIWLPRRRKRKAEAEAERRGQMGSAFVPKRIGGGRAELQGTEKAIPMVDVVGTEVEEGSRDRVGSGVEVDGRGVQGTKYGLRPLDSKERVGGVEMDGMGVQGTRYGLRPEELDSEGRLVGELHGDGRQFRGAELQGSKVLQ